MVGRFIMQYDEAIEWLTGRNSTWNTFAPQATGRFDGTGEVQCAQADLAMIQQAYWIVKAHKEGLVPNPALCVNTNKKGNSHA